MQNDPNPSTDGDYVYPVVDAAFTVRDGLVEGYYHHVGESVLVTDAVWRELLVGGSKALALGLAAKYRAGVYADPPEADKTGEANAGLAIYQVGEEVYWIQPSGGLLIVMKPSDY